MARQHRSSGVARTVVGLLAIALPLVVPIDVGQAAFPGVNGLVAYSTLDGIALVHPSAPGNSWYLSAVPGDANPAWSPDGAQVAFDRPTGDRFGPRSIYVMSRAGTAVARLTDDAMNAMQPAWSPDGTKIVFAGYLHGEGGLFIMNADGSNVSALTGSAGEGVGAGSPAWSPAGDKIAFTRGVPDEFPSNTAIFSINPDGSGLARLTPPPGSGIGFGGHLDEPNWSPDGSKLVFHNMAPTCAGRLNMMNADGSDAHVFIRPSEVDADGCLTSDPVWSPDGTSIAFSLTVRCPPEASCPRNGLYAIGVDGEDLTQIISGDGWSLDWQALGGRIARPGPSSTSSTQTTSTTSATTSSTTSTSVIPTTTTVVSGACTQLRAYQASIDAAGGMPAFQAVLQAALDQQLAAAGC